MGRLLIGLLMLTLTACHSGWDKDPFAGEDERIKNAIEPDEEIPKIPPPDRNALSVKMKHVYSVVEGETLAVPVDWQISHPDVEFSRLSIAGLEEKFPGSEYDKTQKVIKISPTLDFVPVDAAFIAQPLTLSFFTTYEGREFELKHDMVIHVILQNSTLPVIETVEMVPNDVNVYTGTPKKLVVKVFDSNREYAPRLNVVNAYSTNIQGAQFVRFPDEGVYNPTDQVWEFEGTIDIPRSFYIPANQSQVRVEIFAYSINGVPSRSFEFKYTMRQNRPEAPKVVAEKTIFFTEKQENQYTFSAFDPLGSGVVTTTCEEMPAGMRCDCRRDVAPNNNIHFCTLTWVPETTGEFKMKFQAVNKIRLINNEAITVRPVTISVQSTGGAQ